MPAPGPATRAQLYDLHMHAGFFADPLAASQDLERLGLGALCATVTPDEYERLQALGLANLPHLRLGLGLHPWWIADGRCDAKDIERAAKLAGSERYIAEVGLDFGGPREATKDAQIAAFDAILGACENGGHLLSVHAVHSACAALDLLDAHATCGNNEVVFHWFSGSGPELTRAVAAGYLFSINPRMLKSRRGRAWAAQIPAKQLLLETDLPSGAEEGQDLDADALASALAQCAEGLARLRGEDILPLLARTSARLLEFE